MLKRLLFLAAVLPVAACLHAAEPADIVLRNALVYTMDTDRNWATAVAIKSGRIVFVGDDGDIGAYIHHDTQVIDLGGRMVLPGFHDSHIHPMSAGLRLIRCDLRNLEWPEKVHARIRDCNGQLTDDDWLIATGLPEEALAGSGPSKHTLDKLVPDRPAFVRTFSGFDGWVNSKALAAAGIDADTAEPDNGVIERLPNSLEPSGTLRLAGTNSVYAAVPDPSPARYRKALAASLPIANRFGITSVVDASIENDNMIAAYQIAEQAGELTVRVYGSLQVNSHDSIADIDELIAKGKAIKGKRLRADGAKIFVDGQFTMSGLALLEPHANTKGYHGQLRIDRKGLTKIVAQLDAADFQIHAHSFGDRATHEMLNAIETAIRKNGPRDRRHQLAHLQIIAPDDLPRFAALGVVADFQPLWAWANPEIMSMSEPILGPVRSLRQIQIASMNKSGARIVAGSDWISASMNPLDAIQIAVTRRPLDGGQPAWLPDERADLDTMLAAYTVNGAWLAREDTINGSIEIGKAADIIVLSENLFDIDPMHIKDVEVLLTMLDGVPVYRDPRIPWRH